MPLTWGNGDRADKDGDGTVVPIGSGKRSRRKRAAVPALYRPGRSSPVAAPAAERFVALLNRYGQQPGETCAADSMARMHPGDYGKGIAAS